MAQLEPWLQSTQLLHFNVLMALLILVVTVLICETEADLFLSVLLIRDVFKCLAQFLNKVPRCIRRCLSGRS